MISLGLWGALTILAAAMGLILGTCVLVFIGRLEDRMPAPMGEEVGAHKTVLAKLRKREPMTRPEVDYATELVADARSPLAYTMPATLFTMGLFYVFGCMHELDVHGGKPSFRTLIGLIPMLASINMAAQLRRVAALKGRLQEARR